MKMLRGETSLCSQESGSFDMQSRRARCCNTDFHTRRRTVRTLIILLHGHPLAHHDCAQNAMGDGHCRPAMGHGRWTPRALALPPRHPVVRAGLAVTIPTLVLSGHFRGVKRGVARGCSRRAPGSGGRWSICPNVSVVFGHERKSPRRGGTRAAHERHPSGVWAAPEGHPSVVRASASGSALRQRSPVRRKGLRFSLLLWP